MKFWFLLFAIDLVCIVILKAVGLSYWQTLLSIVIAEIVLYIIYVILHSMRLRHLLDEKCDPVEYLNRMQKQKQRIKRKPKLVAFTSINVAVGYMLLGDYATAKSILSEIDQKYLSDKNGTLLVYTIDTILCCYELGQHEEANRLYETQLPVLAPMSKRLKKSLQILVGERYYYLGQYEECKKHLSSILDIELTTRQQLGILYLLAKVEILQGNYERAAKRLKKVAKFGNKLWIAAEADRLLQQKEFEAYR